MSLLIDNTDELLTVIKKLNLKVTSVEELRNLLGTINANYNPEAARQRTGKLIGVAVPSSMATAAGVTSFFLLGTGHEMTPFHVGALALIWSACAVVSTAAVLASAVMTTIRRGGSTTPERTAEPRNLFAERLATGITTDLS